MTEETREVGETLEKNISGTSADKLRMSIGGVGEKKTQKEWALSGRKKDNAGTRKLKGLSLRGGFNPDQKGQVGKVNIFKESLRQREEICKMDQKMADLKSQGDPRRREEHSSRLPG